MNKERLEQLRKNALQDYNCYCNELKEYVEEGSDKLLEYKSNALGGDEITSHTLEAIHTIVFHGNMTAEENLAWQNGYVHALTELIGRWDK